jgi:hypothetical protein
LKARRRLLVVGAAALAAPPVVFAQAPGKPLRVGFLVPTTRNGYAPRIEGVKTGLRELDYIEGKTPLIEYRSVEDDRYDRLPDLAAQLVALKVALRRALAVRLGCGLRGDGGEAC